MNMLRNSDKSVIEANTFEKMYNLRLLKLSGVQLSGTSKAFPKRLRWLYWRGFPSTSIPNDFPLENLVSLDMRYSNLKRLWNGTKVLGSMKILNLSHSPKLVKTPDFSRIPNLEKLVLKACSSLFEVDESIVHLQRLESLNLQDCKNLRKLPRNIGMVESLEEIDISGCSNLMGAMEELEKMKSLQVLNAGTTDINRFLSMEVVSQASIWPWVPRPRVQMSLASLPSSLVRLNLSGCNLTEDAFPRDLCKLSKLQHLLLAANPISSLPNFIKDLTDLQTLDVSHCTKLQQIRWSTTSILKLLIAQSCNALENITLESGAIIERRIQPSFQDLPNSFIFNLECFKKLPIGEVDVELLNSIGFFNLDSMGDAEVTLSTRFSFKCPDPDREVKLLYEDNVFNTYFPGREVPHWFSNINGGSTISFTATLSPDHFGFRGLNLCAVYTLPVNAWKATFPPVHIFSGSNFNELYTLPFKACDQRNYRPLQFEINNKSSGMKTIYESYHFGILNEGGDLVWLSHCFDANLLTEGDEVEVSFRNNVGQIKECGVHFLYFEEEEEVFQYVSSIQHSWHQSFSLYMPEPEVPGRYRPIRRIQMGANQNERRRIQMGVTDDLLQ